MHNSMSLIKIITHCVAFLPWFEEINLELAQAACK
jgi:hypothetical protein